MPFAVPDTDDAVSLRAKLTLRYLMALALIACVLLSAFFVLTQQIKESEKDAHIINISGMQRMLSQRTALFAQGIYFAKSADDAAIYVDGLHQTIEKMRQNHMELTSGAVEANGGSRMSSELQALYYGQKNVKGRVLDFLNAADDLLEDYERDGIEAVRNSGDVDVIVQTARDDLLGDLNAIVFQYQVEAEARVEQFKRVELMVMLVGFLVLLLEVLFIFRPMTRRIVETVGFLERANAELREFSYRISHDLRAPIVSSMGLVDLSKDALDKGDVEVPRHSLNHIDKSLNQLEALIEDVINLTKMKMVEIEEDDVDVHLMVDEILQKLSNIQGFDEIDVRRNIEFSKAIRVKPLYFRQSIENLLSNAVKYRDPKQDDPFVEVSIRQRGQQIIADVVDNGIGIPKDYGHKIFKMFQRFHPKVSFGSGLGLYLVKQNAEALGGYVEYSHMEPGSRFRFVFPVE